MNNTSPIRLEFDPQLNIFDKEKQLRDGLSIVVQIGDTLWVANDETLSIERLTLVDRYDGITSARDHRQYQLGEYLELPVPPSADTQNIEEADLEGADYAEGYLWLVGSHSLKRRRPKVSKDPDRHEKGHKQLAKVSVDGNRYLLARIPVVLIDGQHTLMREAVLNGSELKAAQLRGDRNGNDLIDALKDDEHLGPFLKIPGKDNGFDIEGLVVSGERLLIGLRGPVLRGWAVILEIEPVEAKNQPSTLTLKKIGPNERRYRKHFVHLGGLGIRDLCREGEDLLILAGPTMDLDGPVIVFRWKGGATPTVESILHPGECEPVLGIPFGKGVDHAEGMTLFSRDGDSADSLLVVYDAAAENRLEITHAVDADLFRIR